jgi:uncharacterized damage-inducible protein DinB
MKQYIKAFRYLLGAMSITLAFGLVSFAHQAAPKALQTPAASAAPDPIAAWVADWTRAKDYTKEYLDAMPEEGVKFKPAPDVRSFAEQMLHLASGHFGFASTAAGIANPHQGKRLDQMEEYMTKAGLTKIVMESYDFVISAVKGMDPKKLNEPVKLFGRFDSTRGGAIAKAFEHQTHHRGQTTIYLRMKGVKPPQEKLF